MKSKALQPMPFGRLSILRRLRMQGPDAAAATQDLGAAEPSLATESHHVPIETALIRRDLCILIPRVRSNQNWK